MPLVASVLETELRKFIDKAYGGFVGFPVDDADTALKWATAIDVYTGTGLLIVPPSTTGALAFAALQAGLSGMSIAAIPLLDAAFLAYATALVPGMLPAFIGVPPPAPLTLTPPTIATIIAGGLAGASGAVQAGLLAGWIDAWFKTGTSTPSGGGPVTPWA